MKKTLIIAVLAALPAALLAQTTNLTITVPVNVPPGLVQAELVQSARQIAMFQIQRANLAQLESANTNLPAIDDGNVNTARQILMLKLRSTTDLVKLNALIATLPAPPAPTVNTNAPGF